MNVDEILTETFRSHEALAPDPEVELSELLARTNRHRHPVSRPFSVLSAAVVVGLIATALALLPTASDKPAGPGRPGSSSHQSTTVPSNPVTQPTTPRTDAGFYTTIAAGWLPKRSSLVFQQVFDQTETLRYASTANNPALVANVRLQPAMNFPASSVNGTAMTIHGKPARGVVLNVEKYGYLIAVKVDATHLLTVSVISQSPGTRTIATHIAQSLQLGRHDSVRTAFTLSGLPTGLHTSGVTYRSGAPVAGTSYTLTRTGAPNAWIVVSSTNAARGKVTVGPAGAPGSPARTNGKPFHGHRTVIGHTPGDGYDLEINEAQPGRALVIEGGPNVPLAALYRIADHVTWTP